MAQRQLEPGNKRRQRGTSSVEMAIVVPVLMVLLLGAFDFGRIMYAGMTVTNASRAGAGYGAQTGGTAVDYNGMHDSTLADATNLPVDEYNAEHVIVTSRRFCRCIGTPGEVDCFDNGCSEAPEIYVEVTALRDFHTVVSYLPIPNAVQLTRTAIIRVQ